MKPYPLPRPMGSLLAAALLTALYGCAASPDSPWSDRSARSVLASPAPGARVMSPRSVGSQASTVVDARPAALVDGHTVRWGELRPLLTEAAGAEALQDIILDRRLAEAAVEAGLVPGEDDAAAEERRLLGTLSDDPATALRLLAELRDRQALGPVRYRALLRRNALLRGLVRDQVQITGAAVKSLYDVRYGPRRQVRLLTMRGLGDIVAARARIRGGAFFGDVATEWSTDASAPRGGLLEPISTLDPSYPPALRQVIWSLPEVGSISDPILLESGYAVVQLVGELPADGPPPSSVQDEIEALVRLSQERLLMDQLARRLLANTQVTIFDEALRESWRQARRRSR